MGIHETGQDHVARHVQRIAPHQWGLGRLLDATAGDSHPSAPKDVSPRKGDVSVDDEVVRGSVVHRGELMGR